MPMIRANRESVDDRFSVLGFTVQSESPLFEVGLATDPALFRPGATRTRRNFYSSRAQGAIRTRRGEAVYLVPPDVLANFIGQPRLYFGLATYREGATAQPESVVTPSERNMYINLAGLTERGLRRVTLGSIGASSYGVTNGHDPSLQWGGDASPLSAAAPQARSSNGAAVTRAAPAPYDDGFGEFPANTTTATPVPAPKDPASASAQAYRSSARPFSAGDEYGIEEGAIPDKDVSMVTSGTCYEPPAGSRIRASAAAQSLDYSRAVAAPAKRQPLVQAQEIITPYYDPSDPATALTCQNNAFSQSREGWFVGVSDTRSFPHSAICQLNRPDGGMGTGFYIGRNRILTCAHNLKDATSVTIIPGRNGRGAKPFGEVTVSSNSWRPTNDILRTRPSGSDLAVIDNVPIAAPNGRYFKFLQATPSADLPIVVCGYSAQSRAVPELTQAIDGNKQHLHGGHATWKDAAETIDYNILTLAGASGSPVYHIAGSGAQLEALVVAVHISGEPAARGANRGCFITPAKIDWIEGRTTSFAARAFAAESFSIHWDTTPYYPQATRNSCWAAAAAMVVGWRDSRTVSDAEIAAKVPVFEAYKSRPFPGTHPYNQGLDPEERPQLADAWNLVPEAAASYTVEQWHDMLRRYGPLYAALANDNPLGGHIRVVVGMTSDGAADGSGTMMYLHDPSPNSPGQVQMSFTDFVALYEKRVRNSGDFIQYQILHAASVPARLRPTMAAPFSLVSADDNEEPAVTQGQGDAFQLAPAPAPLVQQLQQRSTALAGPAAAVEIASVIAGAVMERITQNQGDVTWVLEQLRGLKHPNDVVPSPVPPFEDGTELRLTDWPAVENYLGDEIWAHFRIRWQHNGKSVGNVSIDNIGVEDAVGWGLQVKATIMDDNIVYPRDKPTFAALRITLHYFFTRVAGNEQIAIREIQLFGNGRHNITGRWEQT